MIVSSKSNIYISHDINYLMTILDNLMREYILLFANNFNFCLCTVGVGVVNSFKYTC